MVERSDHLGTTEAVEQFLLESDLAGTIGNVSEVTAQASGLANFVYRLDTGGDVFYLKQRASFIRTRPELPRWREGILDELHAYDLVSPVLPSGAIPEVVYVDRDHFLLVITDPLRGNGYRLSDALAEGGVDVQAAVASTAQSIAHLHGRTLGSGLTVRPEEREAAFYTQQYQWLVRDLPYPDKETREAATAVVERLADAPKSLIWGDLSPKNIVTDGSSTVLVDLETTHQGDPAYDVGYFIGHVLLEGVKADRTSEYEELAEIFRSEYQATLSQYADEAFVAQIMRDATTFTGTAMIYRTFNSLVPEVASQEARTADRIVKYAAELMLQHP